MGKLVVSACLLGRCCKYNGGSNRSEAVLRYVQGREVIAVCPEQLGGLPTPRPPAERRDGRVVTGSGDVTEQYHRGAEETLKLCQLLSCEAAVLKERSPSCGHGQIYDGTFSGVLTVVDGVTAELLTAHDIPVYGESRIKELLK